METEVQKIIKERVTGAPISLKRFLALDDWTNSIKDTSRIFGLNEQQSLMLQTKTLLVLLGIEPWRNFENNIKSYLGIDSNIAMQISKDAEKNIFSKVSNEITEMWQEGNIEEPQNPKSSQNVGVGNSFEQIIANQANAMRPAGIEVPDYSGGKTNNQAPHNLPTEEEVQKKINSYTSGNDPYREPLN